MRRVYSLLIGLALLLSVSSLFAQTSSSSSREGLPWRVKPEITFGASVPFYNLQANAMISATNDYHLIGLMSGYTDYKGSSGVPIMLLYRYYYSDINKKFRWFADIGTGVICQDSPKTIEPNFGVRVGVGFQWNNLLIFSLEHSELMGAFPPTILTFRVGLSF